MFVDECHRTQSGELHKAMKAILPSAVFIGFTGTPLLKADKAREESRDLLGRYIHIYRFHEAVKDQVVLDLCYEARDIDQSLTSQEKVDQWFEAKTRGLSDLAKAQLKQSWGTMQKILSLARPRLEKIVADILLDFETKDRLSTSRGNALLSRGSIYEACCFFELFRYDGPAGNCAIVTVLPAVTGRLEGRRGRRGGEPSLQQDYIYQLDARRLLRRTPGFGREQGRGVREARQQEVHRGARDNELLIVVDKLLTGFDATPATYLYIDKNMRITDSSRPSAG